MMRLSFVWHDYIRASRQNKILKMHSLLFITFDPWPEYVKNKIVFQESHSSEWQILILTQNFSSHTLMERLKNLIDLSRQSIGVQIPGSWVRFPLRSIRFFNLSMSVCDEKFFVRKIVFVSPTVNSGEKERVRLQNFVLRRRPRLHVQSPQSHGQKYVAQFSLNRFCISVFKSTTCYISMIQTIYDHLEWLKI